MSGALGVYPWGCSFSGRNREREDVFVLIRGGLGPQDLETACGPPFVAIGGRLLRIYPGDS